MLAEFDLLKQDDPGKYFTSKSLRPNLRRIEENYFSKVLMAIII